MIPPGSLPSNRKDLKVSLKVAAEQSNECEFKCEENVNLCEYLDIFHHCYPNEDTLYKAIIAAGLINGFSKANTAINENYATSANRYSWNIKTSLIIPTYGKTVGNKHLLIVQLRKHIDFVQKIYLKQCM
ncbi:unnamed protein product [Gordionus sp. m RMFG-2023]